MLHTFSHLDLRQNLILFRLMIRRNQPPDGGTHDFGGAVAEKLFRPAIPTGDEAVQIFADDGILRKLDNRRQPGTSFLRTPALGDVQQGSQEVIYRAVGVTMARDIEPGVKDGAVLADESFVQFINIPFARQHIIE